MAGGSDRLGGIPDRPGASPATVLTIDDQARFVAVARQLIDATPGFVSVADASTGAGGIAEALALRPDLILVDVKLPDLDGFEVCARLRQGDPSVTVVLVSADDDDDDYAAMAERAGATAYIPKQRLTPARLQAAWQSGHAAPPDRPASQGTGS